MDFDELRLRYAETLIGMLAQAGTFDVELCERIEKVLFFGRKATNGSGSIVQRADGRWMGQVTVRSPNGTRSRPTVYGKTPEEAAEKLEALEATIPVAVEEAPKPAPRPRGRQPKPPFSVVDSFFGRKQKINGACPKCSREALVFDGKLKWCENCAHELGNVGS